MSLVSYNTRVNKEKEKKNYNAQQQQKSTEQTKVRKSIDTFC